MLEAAMQQVAEGVVIVDREGRFLFWNEAARKIVGLGALDARPEEWSSAYGCFLPDKVTPYPAEELPLARAMRGEQVHEALERVVQRREAGGRARDRRRENDGEDGSERRLRDEVARRGLIQPRALRLSDQRAKPRGETALVVEARDRQVERPGRGNEPGDLARRRASHNDV